MLPYPPSLKRDTPEHSLLRVAGGVLASLGMLLALLGVIFYQHVVDLILAIIVGIFAVRVLLLWQGHKPQHQQPFPVAATQHVQQTVPVLPTPGTPPLPKLPRSIRPQRSPEMPASPAQPTSTPPIRQPLPPSQPLSRWLPPQPAPASEPSRQGIWQYDDEKI